MYNQYISSMEEMNVVPERTWVAAFSHRLQRQWPTVNPAQLEELAAALCRDTHLRALEPTDAAAEWLRPVLHE